LKAENKKKEKAIFMEAQILSQEFAIEMAFLIGE